MIKVKISKAGTTFKSLEVKGHAGSGPYGHDLVCAAVSAVITGGLNNLKAPKDYDIKLEEGYSLLKANKEVSAHDAVVIETIICGLKTIAEDNSDFITIKAE